jgi:hypothetical protein
MGILDAPDTDPDPEKAISMWLLQNPGKREESGFRMPEIRPVTPPEP